MSAKHLNQMINLVLSEYAHSLLFKIQLAIFVFLDFTPFHHNCNSQLVNFQLLLPKWNRYLTYYSIIHATINLINIHSFTMSVIESNLNTINTRNIVNENIQKKTRAQEKKK